MLHQQADTGDASPAAEAHEEGFAAGLYKFDDVGVQADGGHGQNDEELAQFLQWFKYR